MDRPGARHLALGRLLDEERRFAGEDLDHHAAIGGRQMLQDDIGARQIGFQAPDQLRDRLEATRRGADADNPSFRMIHNLLSIRSI